MKESSVVMELAPPTEAAAVVPVWPNAPLYQDLSPEQVNQRLEKGYLPIHYAALDGHHDQVASLINRGSLVDDNNNALQHTPLHIAVANGHIRVADLLVKAGADVNAADEMAYTPLFHAAQSDRLICVHFLMRSGATLDWRDRNAHTALHWSAYFGRTNVVRYLIQLGIPMNAKDEHGRTPLHWAILRRHAHTAYVLMSQSSCDIHIADDEGRSPLDLLHNDVPGSFRRPLLPLMAHRVSGRAITPQRLRFRYVEDFSMAAALTASFVYICAFKWGWIWPLMWVMAFMSLQLMLRVRWTPDGYSSPMLFANLCVVLLANYTCHFFVMLPETYEYVAWSNIIVSCSIPLMAYYFLKTAIAEPGAIAPNLANTTIEWHRMVESRYCATCMLHRPLRAKHCPYCNRCISRLDHHCPWVNNCVAEHNQSTFVAFLFWSTIAIAGQYWHIYYMLSMNPDAPSTLFPLYDHWSAAYEYAPFAVVTMVLSIFYAIQVFGLFGTQVSLVTLNLTTNEVINGHKYAYMRGKGMFAHTSFDLGWKHNWMQFLRLKGHAVNWKSVQHVPGDFEV